MNTGNAGIGYETTLQLALHGARVYVVGRSPERLNSAVEQMRLSSENPLDLVTLVMDLQSLQSVKDGAEAFMRQETRLDILINNAGVRNQASSSLPPVPFSFSFFVPSFRSVSLKAPRRSSPLTKTCR